MLRAMGLIFAVLGAVSSVRVVAATPDAATRTPAATCSANSPEYLIGPGDTLKVVVSQNQDLNAEVPVRPDGKISTPLVNDVVAVHKSPTQLARDIEKALSQYVREPSVTVIVTHAEGALCEVTVIGPGVPKPQHLPFHNGMTVLDLVVDTGGLSEFAAANRAKIIRTDEHGVHQIRVRLGDLLKRGRVSENISLEPGDILVIPEAWF